MFKKILSFLLVVVMCFSCAALVACGGEGGNGGTEDEPKGLSESPLPRPTLTTDVTIPDDFKIGFIFLHDENSTYDKNFIVAAESIKELFGLTNEQFICKTQIGEDNACYEAAADLVAQGCDIIFANSFGHEPFMLQAAKDIPDVQFCHATGTQAHTAEPRN